jgi:hypothetical protein
VISYILDPSKKGIAQLDDIVGAIPWLPQSPRSYPKTAVVAPIPPDHSTNMQRAKSIGFGQLDIFLRLSEGTDTRECPLCHLQLIKACPD